MIEFSVLLLFSTCLSPVLCFVPAPSDVTVKCKNFTNIIYWNYSELHLQPVFNVNVLSYMGESVFLQTNKTYLDVSEYTNDSEEAYSVSVEAVLSGSRSSSETFQFSYDKQYFSHPCFVDFPPLNLSVISNQIEVTFTNPFYLFENIKTPEDGFFFNIQYNETEDEFECSNEEMLCMAVINIHDSLHAGCINLYLKGSNLRTNVSQEVCGEGIESLKTDFTTVITSVVCVLAIILILIALGVAFFKRLLKQDTYSPILSKLLQGHQMDHAVNIPEQPALSPVLSVSDTNLLVTSDPVSPAPLSPASDEVTHLPINFSSTSEDQEHEDMAEDDDSDGTTNSYSGYDRSKFTIDIGQGDLVDAYGKRGL